MTTFFFSEIKRAFRSPMVYVFFAVFGLLAFLAVVSDSVVIGGSVGNVYKNAPHIITSYTLVLSLFGVLVAAAFFNNAALRDFNHQFNEILFSTPISKASYFFGRFFGALFLTSTSVLGVYAGMALGSLIGPAAGWIDADRIGPIMWSSFANNFFVFYLPNMFIAGAIIYAFSNTWRSTVISFVAAFAIIVLYNVSRILASDIENEYLAALTDVLGLRTYSIHSRYFTPIEKNTVTSLFSSLILTNRFIWTGIASVILFFSYRRFSFTEKHKKASKKKKPASVKAVKDLVPVSVKGVFNSKVNWAQFFSFFKMNTLSIVKSTTFVILFIFATILLLISMYQGFEYFGLQSNPVTYKMIDQINGATILFIMIIVVFFSGEIVWRDRSNHIDEVINASPHTSFVSMLAKTFSLLTIPVLMYAFFVILSMLYQLISGYTRLEPMQYILSFIYESLPAFFVFSALFIFIQVLSSNRYIGYFISILLLIGNEILLSALDIGTNMLDIAGTPGIRYSDMNGFGPGLKGAMWFNLYWSLFGCILLYLAGLMWPRGNSRLAERFRLFKKSFKGKTALGFALVLAAWLAVAGYVYYNTQILNEYRSGDEREELAAEYEKTYKKYQNLHLPVVTDVSHYIDIFPQERNLFVKADLVLKNKHSNPISELHFQLSEGLDQKIEIPGATLKLDDEKFGYQIYSLESPLMPDSSMTVHIESDYISKGFENNTPPTFLIKNGTFFNNATVLPSLGYNERMELGDKHTRKKYDLEPKDRMPALAMGPCLQACMANYLTDGTADWVNIETVISTSGDQIAVAPGSLKKEWQEGGRNYYHYVVDHPSQYFCSFTSADFEVYRRKWQDVDIEIYYDRKHPDNIEMMADAVEKSLKYYTTHFGPYYHKQARIIEFPRYATFAQAFPGTMPYSEAFGFIVNLEDSTKNNVIDAVIAHEMAHQWWAHQEIPANMQGGTMLTESFSEYSSLMVMKQEKDDLQMKDFVKYDFNRYLRGRSSETEKEVPLYQVENQGYVHYGKGAVILYALQDYIGEDNVNAALRGFLEEYRYAPPPYPNTNDFMRYLEPQVPDSLQYLIDDWFKHITLYDFRLKEAGYEEASTGGYMVNLELEARKLRADSIGNETKVPIDDWVDIGVYADRDEKKLLTVKRIKIDKEKLTVSIPVDSLPAKAAVDPRRLLIERVIKDNVKTVSAEN